MKLTLKTLPPPFGQPWKSSLARTGLVAGVGAGRARRWRSRERALRAAHHSQPAWRTELGEKWDEVKGDRVKRRFRKLVHNGEARGVLAFVDDEPVGWCSFGPRVSFAKLNRSPSPACDDAARVVFAVLLREGGLSQPGRLLEDAVVRPSMPARRGRQNRRGLSRQGHGRRGLPNRRGLSRQGHGRSHPGLACITGTKPRFKAAGFKLAGHKDGGQRRVRHRL